MRVRILLPLQHNGTVYEIGSDHEFPAELVKVWGGSVQRLPDPPVAADAPPAPLAPPAPPAPDAPAPGVTFEPFIPPAG